MKRIYLLRYTKHNKEEVDRLVRATTPAQAMRHATKNLFDVSVAGTDDVAELVAKGTKVEDAGDEQ